MLHSLPDAMLPTLMQSWSFWTYVLQEYNKSEGGGIYSPKKIIWTWSNSIAKSKCWVQSFLTQSLQASELCEFVHIAINKLAPDCIRNHIEMQWKQQLQLIASSERTSSDCAHHQPSLPPPPTCALPPRLPCLRLAPHNNFFSNINQREI